MCDCCEGSERKKQRSEEEKKQIITRLNRIGGQIAGIRNMVEEDRYCDDILIQLSAVDKAIKGLANLMLDAHMHTCVIENIKSGNYAVVDEIAELFKRFQ
ncbi:MAG: metal-sensing transcriptional repressor [Clostridia bacterium]|nr:metal-sensing transcriptional repressor [Clostridia bacterium]